MMNQQTSGQAHHAHAPDDSNSCTKRWHQHAAGLVLLALVPVFLLILPLLPARSAPSAITLPFLENRSEAHVLAYLGYPGCTDICPTSLRLLSQARKSVLQEAPGTDLGLLFVNVQLDTPEAVTQAYARAHDPAFSGYSLRAEDRKALYSTLSARGYANGENPASHTGYIYLFSRKGEDWFLERVFLEPPARQALAEAVLNLI
ncbi:SCO family protein [Granulosicoccaceae sp. 1_MG-2023]|nr:SCO family protein [Granulosicoccaceae sp. 1_MG-2023]